MCCKGKTLTHHTMKSLLKDYTSEVYCSLLGNAMTNKNLVVLENHNIIMRRDHRSMKGKVKLISGGGAGIEPAESYYVGRGMLTAAVVGEAGTAPSATEILVAIRELAVDNADGILLLVKNYVGDKLNFGLALDKAVNEDINVKMLVIGDNITESKSGKQGRKGLAGSVLVYKIAGEMAEQDKTLEEIIEECREIILTDLVTVTFAFPTCGSVKCDPALQILEHDEMVLGTGIYGQHGTKKLKAKNLSNVVSVGLEEISSCLKFNCELGPNSFVVLVNNLGAVSKLEEGIIVTEISKQLNERDVTIARLYAGTFMSSFGPQGFSITMLKINSPDTLKYLNVTTSAPGWPNCTPEYEDFKDSLPITVAPECPHEQLNKAVYRGMTFMSVLSEKAASALKQITIFAAEALISCEKQLNIIDSETGDGDAGTMFRKGAVAIKTAVLDNQMDMRCPSKFLVELSEICCRSMGGLSGALYTVFFNFAAKAFQNCEDPSPRLCCVAFKSAVRAMKHYGKAELGDRTVLDALCPAVDSFEAAVMDGKSLTQSMFLAAATCEFKAEETKFLKPCWLRNMDVNVPLLYADAGAHAATIWLRAVSEGLRLNYPSEC